MTADLHLHTTASDGSLPPHKVVEMAYQASLTAISITDHDTIDGLPEALKKGEELGLLVIPGIEISTLWKEKEIHILGYFIDYKSERLKKTLDQFILARQRRAERMVENLKEEGLHITLKRVEELARGPVIGRPHIALALKEAGHIQEVDEAFSPEYIGKGARAYVERLKITPSKAIEMIKDHGGLAILAHPGLLRGSKTMKSQEIETLIEEGLDGIEVFYSGHRRDQRDYYHQLALKKNLLITGGSDFHSQRPYTPRIGRYLPRKYLKTLLKASEELSHPI